MSTDPVDYNAFSGCFPDPTIWTRCMLEALAVEELELVEPAHVHDQKPFPKALRTNRRLILDWEIGATAGFILSLAQDYGESGLPIGTLVGGYVSCVRSSRATKRHFIMQERYICAVIDGLYTNNALSSKGIELADDSKIRIVVTNAVMAEQSPWQGTLGLKAGTWLQRCYETMSQQPQEADTLAINTTTRRLCERLRRTPRPYVLDPVSENDIGKASL